MKNDKTKHKRASMRPVLRVPGARVDAIVSESEQASLRGSTKTKGLFNQPIDFNDLIWGVKREPGLFRVTYGVALDIWDN